ncbi:putative phage abortive infection protein [Serratia fonticola]|uniref:putative phage abortive infection protein n=1 Tax=Serratia fonticola TaxID=47917 RepID=UPI0015C619C2|nr:putative phage abortive infection protein [Serratia fonticola]NYA43123.1 putative phage abortive infection protein [Serratia fonticola]
MRCFVILFITIAIGLCVFYFNASYFLTWPFEGWGRDELGQFGDSWGVLTSIFSVLAFCGVAYSVILQRQSLAQVKKEATDNRDFLRLQRFEGVFFQMLGLLQNIIEDIDISFKSSSREAKQGRDTFHYLYGKLKRKGYYPLGYMVTEKNGTLYDFEMIKNDVSKTYDEFFSSRQQNLAHYFRMVYHIYKFIDDSGLDEKIKRSYSSILRAQISNYELLMLFYNCLGSHGEKMQAYAIKYRLFDNMPLDELIQDEHKYLMDFKAFGSQEIYKPYQLNS